MKFKVQVKKPRELRVKLHSIRWNIFPILLKNSLMDLKVSVIEILKET